MMVSGDDPRVKGLAADLKAELLGQCKPCPYCGGPYGDLIDVQAAPSEAPSLIGCVVRCVTCGACGPVGLDSERPKHRRDRRMEAIRGWNRRESA